MEFEEIYNLFVFDIDSTIVDHWPRIRRNTVPRWPGGTIHKNAWTWLELEMDNLTENPLRCLDVLWGLSTMNEIRYLTARGYDLDGALTIRQLKNLKVPSPESVTVVSNMSAKIAVLTEIKPYVYVDDFTTGQENAIGTFHREIAKAIEALGIHVVVFRNNWADVMDQVKHHLRNDGLELRARATGGIDE